MEQSQFKYREGCWKMEKYQFAILIHSFGIGKAFLEDDLGQ
jgi:hypothetical protein